MAEVPRSAPDSASQRLVSRARLPLVAAVAHLGKATATAVVAGATGWVVARTAGLDHTGVEAVRMAVVAHLGDVVAVVEAVAVAEGKTAEEAMVVE